MKISLSGIRVRAFHGCLPQERTVGNDYLVDLSVDVVETAAALRDDDLAGTVDYARLYALVREEMAIPARLLEHVCYRLVQRVLHEFPLVQQAEVTITKLAPPILGADCMGASVSYQAKK